MAAGNAEVEVPPTLKALLAARLDQLDEAERQVLERGSVEGEIFHRGAVQALAPEETQVTTRLAALVRRELIRPDRAQLAGDDGYRFRHLLIRDAAYDALPKAVRADLHARFADWLDEHGHALVERDEIVGYHLEQAAPLPGRARRSRIPYSPNALPCDSQPPAGAQATARTTGAGLALLTRAAELVRPHRLDVTLELEAAWVQSDLDLRAVRTGGRGGRRTRRGRRRPFRGDARSCARSDEPRWSRARSRWIDKQVDLCRAALPLEEQRGDPRRLALLWDMLALAANFRMQNDDDVHAALQALRYRRVAGDVPSHSRIEWALILGPRPADDALRMVDELDARRPPGARDLARAALLAMLDRVDEAWPLAEARSSHLREIDWQCVEGHCVPRG